MTFQEFINIFTSTDATGGRVIKTTTLPSDGSDILTNSDSTGGRRIKVDIEGTADALWGGITGTLSNQTDLQTALDTKSDKLVVANRQIASYILALTDADKLVEMNVAGANNLTVPLNATVAFPIGTQILISNYGAGQTTIVATATVRSAGGALKLSAQYSMATLIKIASDEWILSGDLTV